MARLLSPPFPSATIIAERQCSIRIISVHLLVAPGFREAVAAGQLLRVLLLDREGHLISRVTRKIGFGRTGHSN